MDLGWFIFPHRLCHLSGPRDEVVETEMVVVLVSVVPVEEVIDVLEEHGVKGFLEFGPGCWIYMGVSINRGGPPKCMVYNGKPY